jgi:hypothetical protein
MTPSIYRCNNCESVCPGFAGELPVPCEYCGSTDVVEVPLGTPEAPPKAPWDDPANWVSGPDA